MIAKLFHLPSKFWPETYDTRFAQTGAACPSYNSLFLIFIVSNGHDVPTLTLVLSIAPMNTLHQTPLFPINYWSFFLRRHMFNVSKLAGTWSYSCNSGILVNPVWIECFLVVSEKPDNYSGKLTVILWKINCLLSSCFWSPCYPMKACNCQEHLINFFSILVFQKMIGHPY